MSLSGVCIATSDSSPDVARSGVTGFVIILALGCASSPAAPESASLSCTQRYKIVPGLVGEMMGLA